MSGFILRRINMRNCTSIFKYQRKQFSEAPSISKEAARVTPDKVVAAPQEVGSRFTDRMFSFLVGCGFGFGMSFYFIEEELDRSNVTLNNTIAQLEQRLSNLEKK